MNEDLPTAHDLGQLAEQIAARYLCSQGLELLISNYRCKSGEIDLIMSDKSITVFVEVRARKEDDYGSSLESVTRSKQQKIIRAAKQYLIEKNLFDKVPCRFDVVAVRMAFDLEKSEIAWLKDAFWVKY